jgi:hypothetical protein
MVTDLSQSLTYICNFLINKPKTLCIKNKCKITFYFLKQNSKSSACILTRLWPAWSGFEFGLGIYFFCSPIYEFRPWEQMTLYLFYTRGSSLGVKNSRILKVTTHIALVSSIRICGDKPPFSHVSPECGVRSVLLYQTTVLLGALFNIFLAAQRKFWGIIYLK